uniref:DUF4777 domain-containing protein n=1 Tax=Bombyx mori TaxID=7091 RepID=A0A8R2ARR4_BOMMO|nr:protamine-2 [Bombyx mori]
MTEIIETEPEYPDGRLVIQYLQEKRNGATIKQILDHLRLKHGSTSEDLDQSVGSMLEKGTALGFLERKGSHYMNWLAKELCGKRTCRRRRRSRCRRRRRRKIRRRRSCRRKRRRRC